MYGKTTGTLRREALRPDDFLALRASHEVNRRGAARTLPAGFARPSAHVFRIARAAAVG